jgi:hypothetical protein
MIAISKQVLGLLVLVLLAALPLGCGGSDRGPGEERTTSVGGGHGVVVNRSDSGTEVKVGGDHGIVVEHPSDNAEHNQP